MKKQNQFDLLRGEAGSNLIEFALLLPMFLFLILGAVDLGQALYLAQEVAGAAHAAVIYGTENAAEHVTDISGMRTAAQDDAPSFGTALSVSATYGTECGSGGSTYTANTTVLPTCSGDAQVYLVKVTVSGTAKPIVPWPTLPIPYWPSMASTFTFSSSAAMRSK